MQLSVPNRTSPKKGSFDSRPASVKDWIEHLPMANVGETTKLLFEALNDLNHQDIPAQQRFKTLELLQEPVRFVTDHMKKHVVGKPLPPMVKNLKIAHLSREITHTLATGYKVLVMEQIAGVGRKDRKLLLTAIHRSVRLLGVVLLKAFQVYEPYPESVWLEIHSLYRYAESNGLHRSKVTEVVADTQHSSTITDCYKQILLLALACPYRLRHGEAEEIYNALEDWAKYSTIETLEGKRTLCREPGYRRTARLSCSQGHKRELRNDPDPGYSTTRRARPQGHQRAPWKAPDQHQTLHTSAADAGMGCHAQTPFFPCEGSVTGHPVNGTQLYPLLCQW